MQEVSGLCTSPFSDTDELKMALRARKVSGAFEKRARGHLSWSNWNLEMLVFVEGGKPKKKNRKTLGARRESTTNSIHVWHRAESNLCHIGGRRTLFVLCFCWLFWGLILHKTWQNTKGIYECSYN